MTFNDFADLAREEMGRRVPGMIFSVSSVRKAGTMYTSIMGSLPGSDVHPTLDLLTFFRLSGTAGCDYALDSMERSFRLGLEKMEGFNSFDFDSLSDYGSVRDRLSLRLIRADDDFLKDVPHRPRADLSIVYYVDCRISDLDGVTLVNNALFSEWDISEDTLYRDALASCVSHAPAVLRGMFETLHCTYPGCEQEETMWIATNDRMAYGASVIEYPGFLDEAAARIGGDYYILPSSVHELRFVGTGYADPDWLEQTVREVNTAHVPPKEQLSDHVYYYDSSSHLFRPAR